MAGFFSTPPKSLQNFRRQLPGGRLEIMPLFRLQNIKTGHFYGFATTTNSGLCLHAGCSNNIVELEMTERRTSFITGLAWCWRTEVPVSIDQTEAKDCRFLRFAKLPKMSEAENPFQTYPEVSTTVGETILSSHAKPKRAGKRTVKFALPPSTTGASVFSNQGVDTQSQEHIDEAAADLSQGQPTHDETHDAWPPQVQDLSESVVREMLVSQGLLSYNSKDPISVTNTAEQEQGDDRGAGDVFSEPSTTAARGRARASSKDTLSIGSQFSLPAGMLRSPSPVLHVECGSARLTTPSHKHHCHFFPSLPHQDDPKAAIDAGSRRRSAFDSVDLSTDSEQDSRAWQPLRRPPAKKLGSVSEDSTTSLWNSPLMSRKQFLLIFVPLALLLIALQVFLTLYLLSDKNSTKPGETRLVRIQQQHIWRKRSTGFGRGAFWVPGHDFRFGFARLTTTFSHIN